MAGIVHMVAMDIGMALQKYWSNQDFTIFGTKMVAEHVYIRMTQ